jgi:hypothetical protein
MSILLGAPVTLLTTSGAFATAIKVNKTITVTTKGPDTLLKLYQNTYRPADKLFKLKR